MNFETMELVEPLQRALSEQNYVTATPIQEQAIPPAIAGRDILGSAQTGTGKTAAFALPILDYIESERLKAKPNRPLALVLAPTRELAIQIDASFATYGRHIRFRKAIVYGGVSQGSQVRALRSGPHVLVATPGRLLDLMEQGHVDLGDVQILVLDEADRMLDMGFLPALNRIVESLPEERQSLFFSATLSPPIRKLAGGMLFQPVEIRVAPDAPTVTRIDQQVRMLAQGDKLDTLRDLLAGEEVERAIVFTRTKRGANRVAEKLARGGIRTAAIHGNKSQNARQSALNAFRRKQVAVLVATDVAARGIDIDGVTHVINFDMPDEPESYIHRIGRTGRAGSDGIAISFCTSEEHSELRAIRRLVGDSLTVDHPIPDAEPQRSRSRNRPSNGRPNRRRSPGNHSGGGRAKRPGRGSTSSRSRAARVPR